MPKKETVLSVLKDIRNVLKGRGEEARVEVKSSRFIDNGDGTVTDTRTGLMWVKNPHTDLPKVFKDQMTWKDAIEACKDLDFAGHKDWRLPTIEELRSIVDYTRDKPAINITFFPDTKKSWYWTITPTSWSSDNAWVVNFNGGYVGCDDRDRDSGSYVRPVRSSK